VANVDVQQVGGFAGIGTPSLPFNFTLSGGVGVPAPTVNVAGAGTSYNLGVAVNNFTVQVATTGSPTFTLDLQGSLDGTTWTTIGSAISSTGLTTFTNVVVSFVRLNLATLSGGTLTAWMCGV
jgi:hypothetical protein